ncbi:MAG: hypothetical protein QNJ09_04305 [Paracoccaceae bacterium]|nr:hypothetical protein [Paracoccaceae bacterium]
MPKEIEALREKLDLLIVHSDLTSKAEIGAALGVKESTVRWYEKGSDVRRPGTVPGAKVHKLVALVQRHLPGGRSAAEARHLLFGPLAPFAAACTAQPTARWPLVVDTLVGDGFTLLESNASTLKAAAFLETKKASNTAQHLPRGGRFRLRFAPPRALSGVFWGCFLQHDLDGWDVLPHDQDRPFAHKTGRALMAPAARDAMYRLRDSTQGEVRFVVVLSRRPFPIAFQDAVIEYGRLNSDVLDQFAGWLVGLEERDWTGAALVVEVAD